MKKRKKTDKQKIKDKAWTEFSRFIRLRDSDEKGMCVCCTCNAKGHWRKGGFKVKKDGTTTKINFHAGHYNQGRTHNVLFDEQGVHAQCSHCNLYLEGSLNEYAVFMIKKYGHGIIEEMQIRKHQGNIKYYESDFADIAKKYKNLADIFERGKKC